MGYKKYGVDGAFCRHHMRTGAVVSANRAGSDILDESRNLF